MLSTEEIFESDVRRIARLIWPKANDLSGELHEARERDGVFITDETIHVVEATISKKKEKAEKDIEKTAELLHVLRKEFPSKGIKGWFITQEQPTAQQKEVAKKFDYLVVAESFAQFYGRLVDARQYLSDRAGYSFGSVEQDLLSKTGYIKVPITDKKGSSYSIDSLARASLNGDRFVMLGDFGSGKSSTMRELFADMSSNFRSGKAIRFPILLNLRDHHGQDDPAEAITRHASKIGFNAPHHLIRSWRAGYALILLDGFDEITASGWVDRRSRLDRVRHRAMELVRRFVAETPASVGLVISGRLFYFDDNERELKASLGLYRPTEIVELGCFSESQVREYLGKFGWANPVPAWFPARPLLLGYLATHGAVSDLTSDLTDASVAGDVGAGWNRLLDLICRREAQIHKTIDSAAVRSILERLASFARARSNARGPLSSNELMEAFRQIVGEDPNDEAMTLLQRLPGLRTTDSSDNREFVDDDFVDAARAGDVVRFFQAPFENEALEYGMQWQNVLGPIGVSCASHAVRLIGLSESKVSVAFELACKNSLSCLAVDALQILRELGFSYTGTHVSLSELIIPTLTLDSSTGDLSKITFQRCIIEELDLGRDLADEKLPNFADCDIQNIGGRAGPDDIPTDRFAACRIDRFSYSVATTDSIMTTNLPLGVRVLQTILKKTFVQKGRGRVESALYRGLDQREQRLVTDVVKASVQDGLLSEVKVSGSTVYLPNREHGARARRILLMPNECGDPLVAKLANLHS